MSRSLIPMFSRWDPFFDSSFGTALIDEDFFPTTSYRRRGPLFSFYHPSRQLSSSLAQRASTEMTQQGDKFQVMVDVSHFAPEEITVKTVDNQIVVTARHEERADEQGYISRQFCRRYLLPKDIDPLTVTSSLSPEGILTINAPKRNPEIKDAERLVPISLSAESPQVAPKPIPVQVDQQQQQAQQQTQQAPPAQQPQPPKA